MKKNEIVTLADVDNLPKDLNIALYGAGEGGSICKKILEENREDLKIICYIDSLKTGSKDGIKIIKPGNLLYIKEQIDTIMISSEYLDSIEKTLSELKINEHYIFCSGAFKVNLFTDEEKKINKVNFRKTKEILFNERDKTLFDLIIDQRSIKSENRGKFLSYIKPMAEQYQEFIIKKQIKTIIEGGVFDGKNTMDFLDFLPENSFIFGFEPNYEEFQRGQYYTKIKSHPNVRVFKQALWNCRQQLNFFCDEARSKVLDSNTEDHVDGNISTINTISLDEFIKEKEITKVDFIKLDIEGSEIEALTGAHQTMINHRPQLAISIYHQKEHLFEIPLLLDSWLDNYIYRLGHYHPQFVESILYAIPAEIYTNHKESSI